MAKRTSERPVAGFNLVAVIGTEGLCLQYDGTLRPVRFGRGAHVITSNRDLNDPAMPEKQVFDRLPPLPDLDTLKRFLASHEGAQPVCKHGEAFGTVSSTILVRSNRADRLLHAEGAPCQTPFRDYPVQ